MRIEKTYDLTFDVPRVYQAWVSSDTVIPPATAMDINPVVGGHYRLIMDTPEFSGRNEGTFSLVEPEARVCYSWEWNRDGERTDIDVRFTPTPTGCRVDLTHSGFHGNASAQRHDAGWDSYVEGFVRFLQTTAN